MVRGWKKPTCHCLYVIAGTDEVAMHTMDWGIQDIQFITNCATSIASHIVATSVFGLSIARLG